MITLEKIETAIQKANSVIEARNLSKDKLEEASKNLDLSLEEFVAFQDRKSALMGIKLDFPAAQFIYEKLGQTPDHFNKQPLSIKWVLTELFVKLIM